MKWRPKSIRYNNNNNQNQKQAIVLMCGAQHVFVIIEREQAVHVLLSNKHIHISNTPKGEYYKRRERVKDRIREK